MSVKEKIYCPRMVSVSGAGRNVGKTTFACELIKKFTRDYPVTAIKISPHHHQVKGLTVVTEKTDQYTIFREEDPQKAKDSSRMLSSGAHSVFYIESREGFAGKAFEASLDFIPTDHLIVCESGRLIQHVEPGLAFFIKNGVMQEKNPLNGSQILIERDNYFFRNILNLIYFSEEKWQIKRQE